MATVSQVVGVTKIEIVYSRPAVRGRQIWGELVPYNEVWRTGANEATTISFSHNVRVDGHELAAGRYSLFTVPTDSEWSVIFNREPDQWGAFDYKKSDTVLKIKVKPRFAEHQERFQIDFPEVGTDTLLVNLSWENIALAFTVQIDLEATAAAVARRFIANAGPGDGRMVWNWTNYFYQQGWNTPEALTWANDLAEQAPMYWTYALQARLLARAGKTKEALAAGRLALERAKEEASQSGVAADSEALAAELTKWGS
jgi:hypothetical protein